MIYENSTIDRNIRADFPILQQEVHGMPLVYLANAATTQNPKAVLEAMCRYYESINSNVHRGVHSLSQQATTAHEAARETVRGFINAAEAEEIVFTRGTTESINLLAQSFGSACIPQGGTVVLSQMEHHANLVPWQEAVVRKGGRLAYIPMTDDFQLDLPVAENLLAQKPALLAVTQVSNALGRVNPIKELIRMAHAYGVPVLVDGAQAVAHMPVDVQDLDCDFYCFSGHKMYAPMGIGVLYGKKALLEQLPPYQFGGEMISEVHWHESRYNRLPFKFEAGTPAVAEAICLAEAIRYIEALGFDAVKAHDRMLLEAATEGLAAIDGLDIYAKEQPKCGVISFNIQGAHHYDVGVILDQMGIAVRTGHHCAQPLMGILGVSGTVRASFAVYNTVEEAEQLAAAVRKAKNMLT
ncbi:MAG: SufS family cysteine desulfurase [Bacteroidales bacterium]|nr:SufS family cysteine desulfurase [Bacteroidales bacterium]